MRTFSHITGLFCLLLLSYGCNETGEIGNQSGGRVFLFLHTDNIERDYQNLLKNKIEIIREKNTESWGTVLVFKDLYGNLWDLIVPNMKNGS